MGSFNDVFHCLHLSTSTQWAWAAAPFVKAGDVWSWICWKFTTVSWEVGPRDLLGGIWHKVFVWDSHTISWTEQVHSILPWSKLTEQVVFLQGRDPVKGHSQVSWTGGLPHLTSISWMFSSVAVFVLLRWNTLEMWFEAPGFATLFCFALRLLWVPVPVNQILVLAWPGRGHLHRWICRF